MVEDSHKGGGVGDGLSNWKMSSQDNEVFEATEINGGGGGCRAQGGCLHCTQALSIYTGCVL